MARKRGGLAGIWDRNKGIIKTALPAALSFVPGIGVPLAAAAGAAMEGLDRPGESGIGLDIGGAIRGGISGYGIGKGTQSVAGGLKGLFAPKTPEIAAPDLSKYTGKLTTQTATTNPVGSAKLDASKLFAPSSAAAPPPAFDYSGYGIGPNFTPPPPPTTGAVPVSTAVRKAPIEGFPDTSGVGGMRSEIRGGFGRADTVFGPGAEPYPQAYVPEKPPVATAGRVARRAATKAPTMPDVTLPDLPNIVPEIDLSRPVMYGSSPAQTDVQGRVFDLLRGQTAAPSAASMPASIPTPMPTPTPTPAGQPWYRSKEFMSSLGPLSSAAANIIGSQRVAALEEEKMRREEREALARAQLMALFAPRIMASYEPYMPYTGA